jgi:hypothetical protein
MKTLILVPIWQRPEITKIWAYSMGYFLTEGTSVLCVLSREDPMFNANLDIIHHSGFEVCYFQNKPLGQKLNAGIEYALETYDFDYLMNLGSDDLIHPAILSLYDPYIRRKEPFFGLDKVYFFDYIKQNLALTKPYLWGAGRMIRKDLLEKIRYNGDFLYKSEFSRGLDCNSLENIKNMLNIDYLQVKTEDFPYLVDIKSEFSINDFTLMQNLYDLVPDDILRLNYPKSVIKLLYGRKD